MQLHAYVPVVIGNVVLEDSRGATLCAKCRLIWLCASPSPTALLKHARHPAQKLQVHRTVRRLQRSGAVCKLQAHGATRKPQPNSSA